MLSEDHGPRNSGDSLLKRFASCSRRSLATRLSGFALPGRTGLSEQRARPQKGDPKCTRRGSRGPCKTLRLEEQRFSQATYVSHRRSSPTNRLGSWDRSTEFAECSLQRLFQEGACLSISPCLILPCFCAPMLEGKGASDRLPIARLPDTAYGTMSMSPYSYLGVGFSEPPETTLGFILLCLFSVTSPSPGCPGASLRALSARVLPFVKLDMSAFAFWQEQIAL